MEIIYVSRNKARKAFVEGKKVGMSPSKVNPFSYFGECFNHPIMRGDGDTFERIENAFLYYNCNKETGRKIRYFIME